MKATTQRGVLLEILGKVKAAVSSQAALPVCRTILLRAEKGRLSATANNLEACLTGACTATVGRTGAVCAPVKPLEAFLKAATTDLVTLSVVGKRQLRVDAGIVVTTLEGHEAEDFPPVPRAKGKAVQILGLPKALKEVAYAMATEESRPVLRGVCLNPTGNGKVELAASDGYRLAVTSVKAKSSLGEQVIIPLSAVKLLTQLMPKNVTMTVTPKGVAFEGNGLALFSQRVDGKFPDYHQLIPKNGRVLKVDVGDLRKALSAVTALNAGSGIVRLQTRGRQLILSAKDDEIGQTEARVPAKGWVKTAFNDRYLRDLLARLDGEVTLRTTTAQSPGVVRQNGTSHVLMPMFVQW